MSDPRHDRDPAYRQDLMRRLETLMYPSDDYVTEERGRLNLYAIEPPMTIMEVTETHNEKAEKLNGRVAMLGVMVALVLRTHWSNYLRYLVMPQGKRNLRFKKGRPPKKK